MSLSKKVIVISEICKASISLWAQHSKEFTKHMFRRSITIIVISGATIRN